MIVRLWAGSAMSERRHISAGIVLPLPGDAEEAVVAVEADELVEHPALLVP
jgi:hypothetical protein